MASKIQVRRDTLSNWNANNPVLSSGEIAFVTDENKIKIGDGASAFTSLDYLEADAYLDSVVMGDDTTGNYVETLIASDGISISGEGTESASVTVTNTGVLSLSGTTNEVEVSGSTGNITLSLPTSITVDLVGDVTGNADTASTLATARSISLGGDISGSASFDGSADVTITATVADDSHNHIISNVDGLQGELNLKAPLDSPALTGTPTAPTASASVNSTQIATTAFVQTNISNLINGAPAALDTLDELAAALGDDANFASTVTNSLAGKQPIDADLTAIAGLAGTSGFLKKTAENTWSLDTNTYLTGNQTITLSGDVSGSGTTSITVTVADDSHNHVISNVDGLQTALDAKLDSTSYTAADVLAKLLTVDGAGSGIDADLLDGQSSAYYRNVANMNAGTLAIARGGTNTTATPTGGGVAYGTGSAIAYTAAGTAGQVLTSNGTSAPTWAEASGGGEFSAFFLAGL